VAFQNSSQIPKPLQPQRMAILEIITLAFTTFADASFAPCAQPLNCGEYNNSRVCNHSFTGCDVCDTCCKSWLKPVDICNGCVSDECTSGRHLDCCVSFGCDVTNGQCKRAFRSTGAYPNISECEKSCKAPVPICIGSSANLTSSDCVAWVTAVRSSPYFAQANPPACQELSYLEDPCSCTGAIGCKDGRIVSVSLNQRHLDFNANKESALSLLDGLQSIEMYANSMSGPVPPNVADGARVVAQFIEPLGKPVLLALYHHSWLS
jgi:hypothetical protein